jgi:hypothetical protein
MDESGDHYLKLARFRKPKATYFPSCVEFRPNTNTSNVFKKKKGHTKGVHIG